MNYYVKGGAAKAEEIKAAFEKLGIDVLDFGFADRTLVYCSIGGCGGCVQSLPYSINLMHILQSHPDYQELELPVEPIFDVGDWLYHNTLGVHPILVKDYSKRQGYKVEGLGLTYCLQKGVVENEYHLWSIADAKDGDVLFSRARRPFIFHKDRVDAGGYHNIIAHCGITTIGSFIECSDRECWTYELPKPANKEQRDLLFAKMREAGYEWDAEKKELRKTTEPNFKVGDWVAGIDDEGDVATEKIVSLSHNKVLLLDTDGCHTEYPKTELNGFHLWSIADAKDGDVLVSRIDNPFIYNGNIEFSSAGAYVGVSRNGRIMLDMFPSKAWTSMKDVKPATKEQRDLLFAKMLEAGYEWDAGKKELRKIFEPQFKVGDDIKAGNTIETIAEIDYATRSYFCESGRTIWFENEDLWHLAPKPHYDIANFHAGMPVLVRDKDNRKWCYLLYSHYDNTYEDGLCFNAGSVDWRQCVPFNEKTKYLLGTTDMCPEEYINW